MKVVILAGGLGTRLSEETNNKPKVMVEIGGKPILWHMLKSFSSQGYNEFIICAGYKQEVIKEYFNNYFINNCDITYDFENKEKQLINDRNLDKWKVTIIDTGLNSEMTDRLIKIKKYLNNERFILANGDILQNVDISKLIKNHYKIGKMMTAVVVDSKQSKGVVEIDNKGSILEFREKEDIDGKIINAGLYVCEPTIFTILEKGKPFEQTCFIKATKMKQMAYYFHKGFYQSMDTLKEKHILEDLWESKSCPWKKWK